jgi:hypothetical protein
MSIIGTKGVHLTYIIRRAKIPRLNDSIPYNEAIINAVSLKDADFKNDARLAHRSF